MVPRLNSNRKPKKTLRYVDERKPDREDLSQHDSVMHSDNLNTNQAHSLQPCLNIAQDAGFQEESKGDQQFNVLPVPTSN